MTSQAKSCRSTIVPSLRYRNALAAIDWLVRAFGFEKQAVFLAPDNTTVMHAQLTFGNGMVMLGSVDNGGEVGNLSCPTRRDRPPRDQGHLPHRQRR